MVVLNSILAQRKKQTQAGDSISIGEEGLYNQGSYQLLATPDGVSLLAENLILVRSGQCRLLLQYSRPEFWQAAVNLCGVETWLIRLEKLSGFSRRVPEILKLNPCHLKCGVFRS